MLCGEIDPTGGSVSICGMNANKNWSKVRSKIGYCP